jgi:hypothetical protein
MRNPVQQSRPADTDHKKVSATSPRRPRYWVYLLIAVVVIAAALFFGWLPRQETHPNCLSCRFAIGWTTNGRFAGWRALSDRGYPSPARIY